MLIGTHNREAEAALEASGITPKIVYRTRNTELDVVTQTIRAAHFGIYRVDADCSPDAFLALGIAIGLNRPWALVNRQGVSLPADVRGLSGLDFRSFADLRKLFTRCFGDFLDQHAQM